MKVNKFVGFISSAVLAFAVLAVGLVVNPVDVMADDDSCTHPDVTFDFADGVHEKRCVSCGRSLGTHVIVPVKVVLDDPYFCHKYDCGEPGCTLTGGAAIPHSSTPDNPTKCVKCGKTCDPWCVGQITNGDEVFHAMVDTVKQAFGGRNPEQLTLAEMKTSVSYALNALRASGNALPANTVKTSALNNGSSDVAAVVAEDRDAVNQQAFAQAMCQNLGYTNVTPLKTYNMYALNSTYDAKNKSQVITWGDTGLSYSDTAFVVWYNQKLGRTELLSAVVGLNGDVAVSVPALGDVSTMTVVKAK